MSEQSLTEAQVNQFHQDGYIIVRGLYNAQEMDLLSRTARDDKALDEHAIQRQDGEGGVARLTLWNHPGDDLYGMFSRGRRLVDSMENLLGGEVYHYHSKMNMKEPRVGGAWAWHQDYGYWYENGCLFPAMASVMIAVDPATRENGCLQVIRGSHRMGRVNHTLTGDQAGADRERVQVALERLELVYVEMEAGDAVFFHGNLLHRSDQNLSDQPRWVLICCYNAARNDPYKDHHHPRYTLLDKVDDDAILRIGAKRFVERGEHAFLEPAHDHSAKSLGSADSR
jgi:ectoine hydroxylase-related dioxygenase (phytanoyl-CoA dioxygenase family)